MTLWWPADGASDMDALTVALGTWGAQELHRHWEYASDIQSHLQYAFMDRSSTGPVTGPGVAAIGYADYAQRLLGGAAAVQDAADVIGRYAGLLGKYVDIVSGQRDAWELATRLYTDAVSTANHAGPGGTQDAILTAQRSVHEVEAWNLETRADFYQELAPIVSDLDRFADGEKGREPTHPVLGHQPGADSQLFLSVTQTREAAWGYGVLADKIDGAFAETRDYYFTGIKPPQEQGIGPVYADLMAAVTARAREAMGEFRRLGKVLYKVADLYQDADQTVGQALTTAEDAVPVA